MLGMQFGVDYQKVYRNIIIFCKTQLILYKLKSKIFYKLQRQLIIVIILPTAEEQKNGGAHLLCAYGKSISAEPVEICYSIFASGNCLTCAI